MRMIHREIQKHGEGEGGYDATKHNPVDTDSRISKTHRQLINQSNQLRE